MHPPATRTRQIVDAPIGRHLSVTLKEDVVTRWSAQCPRRIATHPGRPKRRRSRPFWDTIAAMTVESSLKTLRQLQTNRRPTLLMFVASFLWTRQNTASLMDLEATLGIDATLDTIDSELRGVAEERYEELLQWCIRTTARLDGTTVRNPTVWLPDTIRALHSLRETSDTKALLTQVAYTDELLQAAAPEDLLEADAHITEYTSLRHVIFRDVAETN